MLSVKRAAAPGPGPSPGPRRVHLACLDRDGATVRRPGGTEEHALSGIDGRPC
jgi:hypothetical protein